MARAAVDDRRTSLIKAAHDVIASDGLEGLRTRSVAARAGVNIATLHYYFPTKEALIGGVAEYLALQFATVHAKRNGSTGNPHLDRLEQEFANARMYREERADLVIVMQELLLRARRDPEIKRLIAPIMSSWREGLQRTLAAGVTGNTFRRAIDPSVGAALACAAITGALFVDLDREDLDQICGAITEWVAIEA